MPLSPKICHCTQPPHFCACPTNWAKCSTCGADITWVKTRNDKPMPINGHIRTGFFEHGTHVPHFSTCPEHAQHRRKKTAEANISTMRRAAQTVKQPVQLDLFASSALENIRKTLKGGHK